MFSIIISFFIVALGQPARIIPLGVVAGALGFALFWRSMLELESRRRRFYLAFFWFTGVQLIQLSWMSSSQYTGPLILLVYAALSLGLGVQFALLSLLVKTRMGLLQQLALSGLWVLFEWSRLYICTGFTWNPVGLFLSCSTYSLQIVSLFGIYGLSFWVIWTNLAGLQAMTHRSRASWLCFLVLCVFPYGAGMSYIHYLETKDAPMRYRAMLVQTALLPEQKNYEPSAPQKFVPLPQQWKMILQSIEKALTENPGQLDLIALPEGTISYGAYRYPYDLHVMETIWKACFGAEAMLDLPPLQPPQARLEAGRWKVTNAYWAQALAKRYGADVLIGLDDERYNAAFLFRPSIEPPERYEKRVLVPVSEYIPLGGLSFLSEFVASQFAITDSFLAGTQAKIFSGKVPFAVSICYEETYGEFSRQGRAQGAELLVNISNDAWYPFSTLAKQHFDHGMIRAVENGVGVLRACNTGITGGVDRFGRTLQLLDAGESRQGALILDFPVHSHRTLYTLWGDQAILWISIFFLSLKGLHLFLRIRSKNSLKS